MVSERYAAETQNIKEKLHSTNAISLTADMWTSVNMEAYLAVTGHFFDTENKMCTTVLGVKYFPKSHTAENIAEVGFLKILIMVSVDVMYLSFTHRLVFYFCIFLGHTRSD